MQIYTTETPDENVFDKLNNLSNTAVALGGFDAIHIGHVEIIKNVVAYAKANNLLSVVYMFRNQPRASMGIEKTRSINTFKQRLEILESIGVDIVVAQWFTPEFKEVSPEDFIVDYLKTFLGAKYAAIGFNYRFGRNGSGNAELFKSLCSKHNIKAVCIPDVTINGITVSSTVIRDLIQDGTMDEIKAYLGRRFSIRGNVISGNKLGRTIGFPTANLELPANIVLPKQGVYITETLVNGISYPSITNVGQRPTVEKGNGFIESHISDFNGDLYDREIEIEFFSYLRDIAEFNSLDELKHQLDTDKKVLKKYFL